MEPPRSGTEPLYDRTKVLVFFHVPHTPMSCMKTISLWIVRAFSWIMRPHSHHFIRPGSGAHKGAA